ncbi:hypothetical protein A1O7_04639 [Cladophialophora yegresii CBS 114405]|uniref:Uncharacterized protein n=1 Tax=Cladophialophora yegresii CBS 114405 TaxID=1182544 RepID=W9W7I1_9EURO|nr:uncharacterized protein A1O7_04639 [Cladophialophora yegresii CBS 114405]EXJ60486.1 hypothetical protein A1O7_04639 [Cladophialophora yegresii CBS 114405]
MEATVQNDQRQSLLCSLPTEIRIQIFTLVLTADHDLSRPYRADRKYYRPQYQYHQKIDFSLLFTCKQIYGDTRLLPISANEHVFWLFNGPWKQFNQNNRNTARWDSWYFSLNEAQKPAIQKVHIFNQQYYLENLITTDARRFPFKTHSLHLTFRHSDWWSWESPPASSDRLGICPWRRHRTSCQAMLAEPIQPDLAYIKERMVEGTWGGSICQILNLRKLVLEFETDERKKSQLEAVVERAKGWKFPLAWEDLVLEWSGQLDVSRWEGVRDLKDDYHFLKEQPVRDDLPKRQYYVVTMVWQAKPVSNSVD